MDCPPCKAALPPSRRFCDIKPERLEHFGLLLDVLHANHIVVRDAGRPPVVTDNVDWKKWVFISDSKDLKKYVWQIFKFTISKGVVVQQVAQVPRQLEGGVRGWGGQIATGVARPVNKKHHGIAIVFNNNANMAWH